MRNFTLTLFLTLTSLAVWAQTNIAGRVTDEKDQPLAGVTILIQGTNTGTTTQADGRFILATNMPLPLTLSISNIGYGRQEITVRGNNFRSIEVKLTEEAIMSDEVVVSASRVPEDIRKAAVTVEKLGPDSLPTPRRPARSMHCRT
ncbi:carboxypeptidase-like regulatory domain-containing protein [Spirosoma taeanense]|uniref:carboxypeptidase-like regulatory domain-containing protein n=1 Tax=Spirosoma taeanense TaxID=2735870 RepID=UPI001F04BB9B|nr:carboxypeptidase-like regulatory domain-containing protein [Spirosoma taeanense]